MKVFQFLIFACFLSGTYGVITEEETIRIENYVKHTAENIQSCVTNALKIKFDNWKLVNRWLKNGDQKK